MERLERHEIDVGGATLEVFCGGTGEPIVCRTHPFEPMVEDLAAAWPWEPSMGRLVAVNPRGLGGSSAVADPSAFTFGRHCDDLEVVRRQLGIQRWVIWGESGGAVVALLSSLRRSFALQGLILAYMGASGPRVAADPDSVLSPRHESNHPSPPATPAAADSSRPAVLAAVDPQLAAATWTPLGTGSWLLGAGNRALVVCPDDDVRMWAAFEQFATSFDVSARLSELDVPTLVVAGGRDALIPLTHVNGLVVGLSHADYVVLPEAAHADVDRRDADGDRYRAAMVRFLEQIRSPDSSTA